MTKLFITMAFSFFSLFACSQTGKYTSMTADEFADIIQDENIQRLDVRTEPEYEDGHIPESINIDVKSDQFAILADSLLDKKRPVALYCRSGVRSKKAADILAEKGYKVFELNKGFLSWQSAGKSVNTGKESQTE